MKYLGITGASGLIGGRFLGKIIFGTTTERREIILNHGWLGWARMSREAQGYAWASQAGAVLSNSFTSKLARDCETPSLILLRKWPCACAVLRDFWEKYGVALGLQAGMCCGKSIRKPA